MAKRDDELQHLHNENDALRAEIVRRDRIIDRLKTEIGHLEAQGPRQTRARFRCRSNARH
jgi:hypothetical protein